jgi:hypothetical protein
VKDFSAVAAVAAEAVTAAVKELEQVASAYAAEGPAHVESAVPEFPVDGGKTGSEAPAIESPGASDSQSAKQEAAHVEDSVSSQEAAAESAAPRETAPESVAAQPLAQSSEPLAAKASAGIAETPAQDTAAMAAAVGGKPVEESSFDSDPAIASIVDSVLANLRPKIVEEISRKLGRK